MLSVARRSPASAKSPGPAIPTCRSRPIQEPGSGPFPDLVEQRRREQAELVYAHGPRAFLPPVDVQRRPPSEGDVTVADDFAWLVVRGERHHFKSGMQASILRVLHEAWIESGRRDGSGLSEKVIGEKVCSSAERFRISARTTGRCGDCAGQSP